MFTGAPGMEVLPTQHDEREADDAIVVSQTLTLKMFKNHQKVIYTH